MISEKTTTTDYEEYRGKCKEMCEALIAEEPLLTLVRGWYHCPIWGKQEHWWCKDVFGQIIDPTKRQFPSKGMGDYEEYNGIVDCEFCGKRVGEDQAYFVDQHVYCSYRCHGKDVGF